MSVLAMLAMLVMLSDLGLAMGFGEGVADRSWEGDDAINPLRKLSLSM